MKLLSAFLIGAGLAGIDISLSKNVSAWLSLGFSVCLFVGLDLFVVDIVNTKIKKLKEELRDKFGQ